MTLTASPMGGRRSRFFGTAVVAASVIHAQSTTPAAVTAEPASSPDLVSEVDPFIGSDWYGQVFVGATAPFGMVKVGPDMVSFDGVPSKFGYRTSGNIVGFSHLHLSGAAGKYGNILVAPVTGALNPADIASPRTDESNEPGYYAATLTRYGARAELTASRRVGFHRYTFSGPEEAHLTVRLDRILTKGRGTESQRFLGGSIAVVSDHEIRGVGRYEGGWNNGGEYRVYFDIVTDVPSSGQRTWTAGGISAARNASIDADQPFGATLDFPGRAGQVVQAKVGLSFVSMGQARRNVLSEPPAWQFDTARARTRTLWQQALEPVRITGGSASKRRQFYTALYHSMLMPSDHNGENPVWRSNAPHYDDFYTIWDTFRTTGPLLTLIAPDRERDMIRSLIDIYRHTGWMPDGRSGESNGRTQGGSNANVLVADAYVKGLKGIDYRAAYEAMLKDATVSPARDEQEGRGGLPDYLTKGYVSEANPRSGSRTVEYAYNDFAIAEVACGLGDTVRARRFAAQASNWLNLWDPELTREGVAGFLRPRNADGSWAVPDWTVRGEWPAFMYEGDPWTYSLYAPQDVRRLITISGGPEAFVKRLDTTFDHLHFDMTNEPGFLIPMLYLWAGRPDKTADRVAEYLEKGFLDTRGGLPGPEDSGAMSSWFVFQSLGFYPLAGQDVYLIGTPSFPDASLALGNGKMLRIIARNFDPTGLGRYVVSAELNGRPLHSAWFRHGEIADGGTLILTMGSAPSDWGRAAPPPSLSDAPSAPHALASACAPAPSAGQGRAHSK
ncbi:GH92 family glycosyl hydrolase [Sphingomonas sp. PB2P12]|uniref:GH92 family glycosyl hydrolase n=1 Tax=Sphingomonas sandaracina TaxID=3096157 RepID=UPI002FCA4F25